MIDAAQAKQIVAEYLWNGGKEIIAGMEDAWESPEERAKMSEWMRQWYEQTPRWQPVEPEEVPCGWLVRVTWTGLSNPFGGGSPFLINAWTDELVELTPSNVGLDFYNFQIMDEALIRCYIERLPDEQRAAAMARWDKLPFAPMRFFPPALQMSVAQSEAKMPISFAVEFDDAYFAQHNLSIPELKSMQTFDNKETREIMERSRLGALAIIGQSRRNGKTVIDYVFTEPHTLNDVPPQLKPRGSIHRIIPNFSKDVMDTLPDELHEAMNLWVKIETKAGA